MIHVAGIGCASSTRQIYDRLAPQAQLRLALTPATPPCRPRSAVASTPIGLRRLHAHIGIWLSSPATPPCPPSLRSMPLACASLCCFWVIYPNTGTLQAGQHQDESSPPPRKVRLCTGRPSPSRWRSGRRGATPRPQRGRLRADVPRCDAVERRVAHRLRRDQGRRPGHKGYRRVI